MRVDLNAFEARYRADADPWEFAMSPYERAKYQATIDALSRPRYERCFEPACSIGVLTDMLALRVEHLVACDTSPTAIENARVRLAERDNIELLAAAIPEWWPVGSFDLIVLSELGYYWDLDGWASIIERCRRCLTPDGEVLAVHWLGSSADHILSGQQVHDSLREQLGDPDLHVVGECGFALDRWTSLGLAAGTGIAAETGMAHG